MSQYQSWRIEAAVVKADQIKATGAKIVATSCHNCIDQLGEINRQYKLGVKVVNTCELTANAIVLPRRMFLSTGLPVDVSEQGYLKDPALWNHEVAQFLATNEGIGELKEEHWRVIDYIRDYDSSNEAWPLPQRVNKDLTINIQHLFSASPEVVFKIAGLAEPRGGINWHEGSVQSN
jgi:tRNA 2-thiouridine synthesizing protein E